MQSLYVTGPSGFDGGAPKSPESCLLVAQMLLFSIHTSTTAVAYQQQ